MQFSMSSIRNRVYLMGGRLNSTFAPEIPCSDSLVLREDLSGWDTVPDLEVTPLVDPPLMMPYNL